MSTRASSHISAGGSLRAFVSRVVLGEQGSWTIDLETMGRVVLPKLGVCIASACICVFAPSVAMAPKKQPPGGAPAAAPMKKVARQRASRTTTATQAGAADEVARPVRNVATAVVQATAPESLVAPLAGILGKRVDDLPSIRKIRLPDGMFVSVYDVIVAMKGCSQENASKELGRIRERYGDNSPNWRVVLFRDSRGRTSAWGTPVADARNIVKIILLLPGEQAAKVRLEASRVFVGFLGGNLALVDDILQNRRMQELLQRENPEHWTRLFGEAVETSAGPSSSDDGAVAARVATAVLPQLAEQLVPLCLSKFQEAAEKHFAAQEQLQCDALEKVREMLAQRLPASPRAIVNVNCSARARDRRPS